MKNNFLLKKDDSIIRVLDQQQSKVFVIDCIKRTMPRWIDKCEISQYQECTEGEMMKQTNICIQDMELLDSESRKFVYSHFSLVASVLPFVTDSEKRSRLLERRGISKTRDKIGEHSYG